jgi:hypothetical protein
MNTTARDVAVVAPLGFRPPDFIPESNLLVLNTVERQWRRCARLNLEHLAAAPPADRHRALAAPPAREFRPQLALCKLPEP